MKLFMREHIGLMVTQGVQLFLFSLILLLSGFRDFSILLYGILLSIFLLFSYLFFHYYRRRYVYQKLSARLNNLEVLLEQTDSTPTGVALDQLTRSAYQLFMEQISELEEDQKSHLKFIDRWVHQIKTPLSVIELTAKELDEPESSNIREETDRLKNGLHTVLYMARMRTIEKDFQIQPVSLLKLIEEVNQENKRFYIRNQVYPHVSIQVNDLYVETDEKWLFFMINQLIHNAVKYTDGRSSRMDLSVYQQSGAAVVEVTDYGVGIPEHDQKRIYQAFYTGDNGRIFRESTGMGLHLTKEVADYLGHTLEMESVVDKGTTIRIYFTKTQTLQ